METTIVYWGNIGIMEKKMETTIVYWGYNRVNIRGTTIGLIKEDTRSLDYSSCGSGFGL